LEAPPAKAANTKHADDKGDSSRHSTPRLGYSQGIGVRGNLLKYMPPGLKNISWGTKHISLDDKSSNWPKCGQCHKLARPAIFMFGDFGWKYDHEQNSRWKSIVEKMSQHVARFQK